MTCFIRIGLIILLVVLGTLSHQAQDIYDYANSRKYADYLLLTRQYDLASGEYERLLFFRPDNDTIKQTLLRSYRLSGNTSQGIERMSGLYIMPEKAYQGSAIEYTRLLLQAQYYYNARTYLGMNQTLGFLDKEILFIQTELYSKNYKKAMKHLEQLPNESSNLIEEYRAITQEAMNFNRKSPGFSLALSTVVPGLGKVYANDWKDGVFSFIMVGGMAWQAYRGFKRDELKSVHGWIFGGIGFGFYLGNLYGSFKSAQRYNHNFEHQLEKRIETNFNNNY